MSIEVDWSGPTMDLMEPVSGERTKVYLFVACLPFSWYAFVEATLDIEQDVPTCPCSKHSVVLCHALCQII